MLVNDHTLTAKYKQSLTSGRNMCRDSEGRILARGMRRGSPIRYATVPLETRSTRGAKIPRVQMNRDRVRLLLGVYMHVQFMLTDEPRPLYLVPGRATPRYKILHWF